MSDGSAVDDMARGVWDPGGGGAGNGARRPVVLAGVVVGPGVEPGADGTASAFDDVAVALSAMDVNAAGTDDVEAGARGGAALVGDGSGC